MKVLNLHVENVKRIKVVDITPKGNAVVITGKNGNGKSSTIDSIAMALGGKKLIPSDPVRHGESHAEIIVELGEIRVTRRWTGPDASYLKIERADGKAVKAPQKFLDDLVGNLSFDPLEFASMQPKDRLAMLKDLADLDLSDMEKEYADVLAEKKFSDQSMKKAEGKVESLETTLRERPLSGVTESEEELSEELERIRKSHSENRLVFKQMETAHRMKDNIGKRMVDLKLELDRLKQEWEEADNDVKELKAKYNTALEDDTVVAEKLNKKREDREHHRISYELSVAERDLKEWRKRVEDAKEKIAYWRGKKAETIASAPMPIPGLGLGDGEIVFNGVPFNQLSTSEQIRVSMGMAMALNPELKIALIRNGSLLDKDAMERVKEVAAAHDFQVWIERVADGPDGDSIYIEEGEVK